MLSRSLDKRVHCVESGDRSGNVRISEVARTAAMHLIFNVLSDGFLLCGDAFALGFSIVRA